jgi:acyl-CoA thioester hydrolase
MPLTHTRTFRVRHYECDRVGHVHPSNYVRYMQETAFDASAAAGYDLSRYAAMGRSWLIHDTEVEYLGTLHYGDTVQVKTWVVDFRHVRSRRAYEVRQVGTGELVARSHTDWVFMNTVTGRPAPIPPELAAAFFPEGVPETSATRQAFPAILPPSHGVYRLRRRVEWQDLDPGQHVNNAVYLSYAEGCGVQVAEAHGWSLARMAAEGFAVVVRQLRIEYLQQAVLGDELELATWISDAKRAAATCHFAFTRMPDEVPIARARILWALVDTITGRPVRIPAAFIQDLGPNIAL